MTDTTPDDLRSAAAALRAPNPPFNGHARVVIDKGVFIALCARLDHIGQDTNGICIDCELTEVHNETFAGQIAALLNARQPIAAWLADTADKADRHGLGFANDPAEITDGHPATITRALLGKAASR